MKTNSILDEIFRRKKISIESEKKLVCFDEIYEQAKTFQKKVSFKNALKKSANATPAIIAELKKASPSAGLIRENFDCEILCKQLEDSGASALSVLTEENFFKGSLDYLKRVSKIVGIPILMKDFIFDKYQICMGKISGASAVLLIASMLSPQEFKELFEFAKSLDLDVLAEAHNQDEIDMLLENQADIIGVNCRNLKTFSTDFAISEILMGSIPDSVIRVSESAIGDYQTLMRASKAGADAALIGTAIMSQQDCGFALRKILGCV